jgi:hypothetical protein
VHPKGLGVDWATNHHLKCASHYTMVDVPTIPIKGQKTAMGPDQGFKQDPKGTGKIIWGEERSNAALIVVVIPLTPLHQRALRLIEHV